MNSLHIKILKGLGIPIILFVVALLIINFLYVDHQLKELSYSYIGSIVHEANSKLVGQVKEIEELTRVLAAYLGRNRYVDESRIQRLIDNLLDGDEQYDILIVRKPLVIEGRIQGNNQSQLRQRRFNDSDVSKHQHYYKLAQQHATWSHFRYEEDGWKTSYIVPFETAAGHADGIIIIDVSLYALVKKLSTIHLSDNAEILFSVRQDGGEIKTLLLDSKVADEIEILTLNLKTPNTVKVSTVDVPNTAAVQHSFTDMITMLKLSADTVRINDRLDGKEQTFIAQLPSEFSPIVQLIALLPKEEVFMYIQRAKILETISVLIAFGGLVLLIFLISRSISRPITALSERVEVLASGNLNVSFPKTDSCTELNSLSKNLNRTVKQLKNYFSDLKRVTAQNEKINSEINISRDVQLSLLPPHREQNKIDNIDIHACTLPAKEVGGDFYYFFKIDRDNSALVIGDVSGKGMPAAIMMAVCLSLFKAQSANTPQPDVCLQKINRFLMQEHNDRCTFVTLFYALINTRSGELIYANAGHNPPLVAKKDGRVEFLDQEHGMALAVAENVRYKAYKRQLDYGDMLLLYTDGITEAYNMKAEEFGEQRLGECIARHKRTADAQSAKHCVQNIIARVAQFSRGCVQFDDMTVLCAVRPEADDEPQHTAARSSFDKLKIDIDELHEPLSQYQTTIRYEIQEINNVVNLAESFCNDHRINDEIATDLCVILDEFVSNVIRYSQSDGRAELIKVRLAKKANNMLAVIEYPGQAFDPMQLPAPDIHKDGQARRVGGLGVYIARQLADNIRYAHCDGCNILMIEKKLAN